MIDSFKLALSLGDRRLTARSLLHRSTTHDTAEDALSILQLGNAVLQKLSLALRAGRLRGDCLHLRIRQAVDNDW